MQPLQLLPGSSSSSSISNAVQRAALRRLQQRAQHAGSDAFNVLVNGDLQQWEFMVCASFAAGMSLDLQPSTAQDQVCKSCWHQLLAFVNVLLLTPPQFVQELRLPLWLGRTLALSSEEQVSCKRHIEYEDAAGRIQQLQVSQRPMLSIAQQLAVAQSL
jgi:hypothetical protein